MIKNYFKIAFRNLYRNKAYSFINITGLTLGISCSSLLFMFVIDELSFDSMHTKKDQIYRIIEKHEDENETLYYASTPAPVGNSLVQEYKEVELMTRLFKFGGHVNFSQEDQKFQERAYFVVDSSFFDVFDYELLYGDPSTALVSPNSIVISEDWANILYGNAEQAFGKMLSMENGFFQAEITGVLKNMPQNSHLQANMLISIPTFDNSEFVQSILTSWDRYGADIYIVLNEKSDIKQLANKMPDFIDKYFDATDERVMQFQALTDIHFGSKDIQFGPEESKGEIAYIYIFIAIGIFMLAIACINYMNLATAKSMHRGKEIGMRKVSGASRSQLITQFLSESTLISLISFGLSVGLVDLVLPYFNEITSKSFEFNMETFSGVLSLLLFITLAVGLLSGTYPALLMSRLQPASILKGEMHAGRGSLTLRKILVITQFSLSIIMIIATIVASKQMSYIQSKSLGFDSSQMVVVDINSGNVRNRFETMKTEFAKSPYINKVAVSSRVPGEWKRIREIYMRNVGSDKIDSVQTFFIGFDKDMKDTYEMTLLEGNNFTGNLEADSLTILINEKAAELLNLDQPIGAQIYLSSNRGSSQYRVIGVLKNYNFQSLHNEIGPMIMGYRSNIFQSIDYFTLKIDTDRTQEALAHASKVHDMFDEGTPMEYHFLDQQWAEFYKNDKRAGDVFLLGAGVTILIACLGLFGLASFIVQKRTKEIGVRKVLGASIPQLFILLSKTFVVQVGIAFLIAVPISWYFMSEWLNSFAFKFGLGVSEFLMAGCVALFIALASVSYRVAKASTLNPAQTLKDE